MAKEVIQNKVKVHIIYKLLSGERVPGVTTILGILNKPALLAWAWRLGDQGIEMNSYRDDLAGVGKLVHSMILEHYDPNRTFDPAEFTPRDHDRAANSFLSFLEWEKHHLVEPVLLETPLVHEAEAYGGTLDFYGRVDGLKTLMDFKSGSGIYEEAYYQAAAYRELLKNGHPLDEPLPLLYEVEQTIILNVGRSENEDFNAVVITRSMDMEWQIFLACRAIHRLRKEIKKS